MSTHHSDSEDDPDWLPHPDETDSKRHQNDHIILSYMIDYLLLNTDSDDERKVKRPRTASPVAQAPEDEEAIKR